MSGPFAASAAELVACGFAVLPLKPNAKQPAISRWQHRAATDATAAAAMAAIHGQGNIGILCGNGLVVVDVDVKGGMDGIAALRRLERQHGPLPATVAVDTPTGGAHLYFAVPAGGSVRNSASTLAPGVDVRGGGGYVVAPRSIHPNGGAYKWQKGLAISDVPIADLPVAWLALLQQSEPATSAQGEATPGPGQTSRFGAVALAAEAERVAATPEGARNNTLARGVFKIAQLVAANHIGEAAVFNAFDEAAERAGLGKRERRRTIRSAMNGGKRHPRAIAPPSGQRSIPALTIATLDAVQPAMQHGLRLRAGGDGYVIANRSGVLVSGVDLPILGLDPQLVACIGSGCGRLGSVNGFRVLHWEVCESHRQWLAGVREFHRLAILGGWRALAELIGVPDAADEIREIVLAQAHLRFTFAGGARGNLLQYSEPVTAAPNQRALLVLSLGDPLLRGYASDLPAATLGARQRRDRWLVPMLSTLPPLHALPSKSRAPGVRLHWLFLRALTERAAMLAKHGGILLSIDDWHELAAAAGLRLEYLPRLLLSWQDSWAGGSFLSQPDQGVWTLGPEHAAAIQFIQARRELGLERRREAARAPLNRQRFT